MLTRFAGRSRQAIVFFALLAFALQSYLTQTHIHAASFARAASIHLASLAGSRQALKTASGKPDKYPPGEDPANCPLCQEILHAGHYVAPSAVVLLLPAQTASIVPLIVAPAPPSATSAYSWQSRAPPARA